ncbi:MAG TPA: hypothetical protein VEV41_20595 [Terriglobales bacterium]|jgi:hypothetical protein|nr:hypothetical protein [Terriglobales bacterium]
MLQPELTSEPSCAVAGSRIAVVIPALNEEQAIVPVLQATK